MDFEDMQVIWDSQNKQPLYGVDEAGLHTILRTKSQKFGRLIFWQQTLSYLSSLLVITSILMILLANYAGLLDGPPWAALSGWDILALLVAMSCWVHFGVSIYFGQKRQKHRERQFTTSLRDDLDRGIEQTEYQIRTRKHLLLGFLPPSVGVALLMFVGFRMGSVSQWLLVPVIVVLLVNLVFESRSQQRLVEREIVPRKQELETLREKLTERQR